MREFSIITTLNPEEPKILITSDHDAHMSTRNTLYCMGQGQAVGTATALCDRKNCGTRELEYASLRYALINDGVYLEN